MIGLALLHGEIGAVRVVERDGAAETLAERAAVRPAAHELAAGLLALIDAVAGDDRELAVTVDLDDALVRRFVAPPTVDARARRRMAEAAALPLADFVGPAPELVLVPVEGVRDEYDLGFLRAPVAEVIRAVARARRLRIVRIRWLPAVLGRIAPDVQAYARVDGTEIALALLGGGTTRRVAFHADEGVGWAFQSQLAEARNVQQAYEPVDVQRLVLDPGPHGEALAREIREAAAIEVLTLPDAALAFARGVAGEAWSTATPVAAAAVAPLDFSGARSRHVELAAAERGLPPTRIAAAAALALLVVGGAVEAGRAALLERAAPGLERDAHAARTTAERVKRAVAAVESLDGLADARRRYAVTGDRLALELERLATLLPRDTWIESVQLEPATGRMTVHGYAASPGSWSRLVAALAPRAPQGGFAKQLHAGEVVEWRTSIASAVP